MRYCLDNAPNIACRIECSKRSIPLSGADDKTYRAAHLGSDLADSRQDSFFLGSRFVGQ